MRRESDKQQGEPAEPSDCPSPSPAGPTEIHLVAIAELLPARSPRLAGEDTEHIHRLVEADTALPPILVHRATLRIIDGMHRVRAAELKGRTEIEVEFFDGSEADAFVHAVQRNIAHGLPLSLADRKAAALRIISTHPQWSDRTIASRTGLSGKTVGAIRRRSSEDSAQSNTRVGSDGRTRPLDATAGRIRAFELLTARPDAPLREIAQAAGISVGTAHDVRTRMRRGQPPVPPQRRPARDPDDGQGPTAEVPAAVHVRRPPSRPPGVDGVHHSIALLQKLAKDPSLRNTALGRQLLRLLHMHVAGTDHTEMVEAVPAHCTDIVVELAQQCAQSRGQFARELARREHFFE
jgi:ParB-like chromosome segregation protein Spo0J